MWQYRGRGRPDFAAVPGPGQESVWDYPRPPRLVRDGRRVEVRAGETVLADTRSAWRALETASPPTFYLPPQDVAVERLAPVATRSFCEWKGAAAYWCLRADGDGGPAVAWTYPDPSPAFRPIAGWFAFYPGRVECFVEGERVRPQPGGFYGGWVTAEIVGPFKGEPGTGHW